MDDDQPQDTSIAPETVQVHETPVSSQSDGSQASNMPPEALESPTNAPTPIPVEYQNGGVNQSESDMSEQKKEPETSQPNQTQTPLTSEPVQSAPTESAPSVPAPLTPPAPEPQSPAQQNQTGFIRALLVKAQAKIQFNKQKKLDKIILFAQKKKMIANEDVQKLLYVSDATATRYLVNLVQQGRLARVGNPRDAKYQFLR